MRVTIKHYLLQTAQEKTHFSKKFKKEALYETSFSFTQIAGRQTNLKLTPFCKPVTMTENMLDPFFLKT